MRLEALALINDRLILPPESCRIVGTKVVCNDTAVSASITKENPMVDGKEWLVCGSFGHGNIGDEAVRDSFEALLWACKITPNFKIVTRFNTSDVPDVIPVNDICDNKAESVNEAAAVFVGGGIIEPYERATVFRCAQLIKKLKNGRVHLFCINADAYLDYNLLTRIKLRYLLRHVDFMYARDVISEHKLRKIFPNKNIITTGDIVFWLPPIKIRQNNFNNILKKTYVLITLTGQWLHDNCWMEWLSAELVSVSDNLGLSLLLFSMSPKESADIAAHGILYERIIQMQPGMDVHYLNGVIDYDLSPGEAAEVFRRASLTISMRLHGCVMSYAQKTPFVGIAYHPKIYGFCETVGHSTAVVPEKGCAVQSKNSYGYSFDPASFEAGSLLKAAELALEKMDFSRIDHFKKMQQEAMLKIAQC